MAHFPKPWELSNRMPMALIQTTLHFGSIVKKATAADGLEVSHSCGGKIESTLDAENEKIVWHCNGCADKGEISHWRGSGWDNIPTENMPKLIVKSTKPRTPKKEKSFPLVLNKKELSALIKALGDSKFGKFFSQARPLGAKEFAIDLTLKQLDSLYSIVGDLLDFGPSRQRKMWDETLNAIAWAMDEITMAEAFKKERKK